MCVCNNIINIIYIYVCMYKIKPFRCPKLKVKISAQRKNPNFPIYRKNK